MCAHGSYEMYDGFHENFRDLCHSPRAHARSPRNRRQREADRRRPRRRRADRIRQPVSNRTTWVGELDALATTRQQAQAFQQHEGRKNALDAIIAEMLIGEAAKAKG